MSRDALAIKELKTLRRLWAPSKEVGFLQSKRGALGAVRAPSRGLPGLPGRVDGN